MYIHILYGGRTLSIVSSGGRYGIQHLVSRHINPYRELDSKHKVDV